MSDRFDPSETVRDVAESVGDSTAVDWDEALRQAPDAAGTIEGLRLIERVAAAHRLAGDEGENQAGSASVGEEVPLFTWGSLQAVEKIGEGGFAEVYRAWDPSLRRLVALKLRRPEAAATGSSRWIEEARRLATVRHPNVLIVHGAAVHDERAGIWTDLIEGSTLEEWVREHGLLGAREAALIVTDLCLALAAVHGAGLVHGDVKAANVMRETGGRLVLMDFGSGQRLEEATAGGHSGTPLISAPELLDGAPATPESDVYALGVLLYWLVSREYPVEAESLEELRRRHREGPAVPLRERRPDLPAPFVRIVERALAADAAARWDGPSELETALATLLSAGGSATVGSVIDGSAIDKSATGELAGTSAPGAATTDAVEAEVTASADSESATSPRARSKRGWLTAAALAVAALAIWLAVKGPTGDDGLGRSSHERLIVAGSELSVELGMVEVDDGAMHELAPGSPLSPGMRLALRMQSSTPAHVYVLNEDEHGELFVLFPVDGVDLTNPLPPEVTHVLPGRRRGRQQSWVVTSAGGTERFLAVVSRHALPTVERAIADLRRASADRVVDDSTPGSDLLESLRGVGGMADVDGEDPGSVDVLERIAASLVESSTDPEGLWVWGVSFPNPGGAPPDPAAASPVGSSTSSPPR